MLLCEAAGFDVVLVETVGIGQSETAVCDMTDFFLALMLPGAGDELQGIKKGLVELADMIAINKADGDNIKRANLAAAEYRGALHILSPRSEHWHPPVLTYSALTGTGMDTLWQKILDHRTAMNASGEFAARRREQQVKWMWSMLEQRMMARLRADPAIRAKVKKTEAEVADGRITPAVAAEQIAEMAAVSEKLRILVTGFGPFPGAPYNPTQPLVARLMRLRRPAFADVELSSHIFPVTYKAVDRELPLALAKHKPQALLMFGLAGRTGYVRVETRARNAVTMLWPDAAQTRARKGSIADGADAQMFGPHTAKLLRAAEGTGIDARASRDAGSYLCNYLSWRAIEAVDADNGPRLAAFVHIPPLARGGATRRKGFPRITLEELVDAGEAMLLEMVRLARRAS